MTLLSRALGRLAGLRPPETREVLVERDVRLRAPDGVELLTDLHLPADGAARPAVLVRTPYGRTSMLSALALPFAERGYNVVIQSTRGTFGSGGEVDFAREAADGRSVADWIVEQRWSDGTIATFGPSYLSFTQWALASTRPPQLRAMAIQIMSSDRRRSYYPGGSFALDTALEWVQGIATQELPNGRLAYLSRRGRSRAATARMTLPLRDADLAITGHHVPYYQQWLEHPEPGDPYWEPIRYTPVIPELGIPISFVAGWYDYFLPYELDDWEAVARSGAPTQLVVGPWTHRSGRGMLAELREALDWFDLHLRGLPRRRPAAPVRLALQPKQRWLEGEDWPHARRLRWHLWPDGALREGEPPPGPPARYRYDPAHPTPQVGGSTLSTNAGPRDNRRLEARADVLTFSSRPLDEALTLVGPIVADLYVECDRQHFDLFARLCDVDRRGRSINVTDGLLRVRSQEAALDAEGVQRVVVELFPTAYRFAPGHRVRLQVSGGSHPRYARNLGSGEPLSTGTTMLVQSVGLHHDPVHPSGVDLPVFDGP